MAGTGVGDGKAKATLRGLIRGRDLALAYVVVVAVVAWVVFDRPSSESARLVLQSSTNLHNLRARPLAVLGASAFLVSSPWGLWLVPVLVGVLGATQRWVGRTATLVAAVFGHVLSTVFVAVLLGAGIATHSLDRSLARQPDVGVSYVLAAVWGLLLFRAPPRRRRWVGLAALSYLLAVLVLSETFTDLGHLVAWLIGAGMGLVGACMSSAAQCHADGLSATERGLRGDVSDDDLRREVGEMVRHDAGLQQRLGT